MNYKEQKNVETLKSRLALLENTIALIRAELNDKDLDLSKKDIQEKKKDLKYNEDLAKKLSDELAQVYKVINERQKREREEKDERRRLDNKKKIKTFYDYCAHIGTLESFEEVDPKIKDEFMRIRNFGPVRVAMRKLGLK